MEAPDHGIDCLCDECWGPSPKCFCGAGPSYTVGPSRTPMCARCRDKANEIRGSLVAEAASNREWVMGPGLFTEKEMEEAVGDDG